MNVDDLLPPKGPQGLTELSEARVEAQIERQCEIYQNYGLDPEWYDLVKWWVTLRRNDNPPSHLTSWRVMWHWRDEYWPAGGELEYRAWFRVVDTAHEVLGLSTMLHWALNARKRHEREMRGPLESSNPYTITL